MRGLYANFPNCGLEGLDYERKPKTVALPLDLLSLKSGEDTGADFALGRLELWEQDEGRRRGQGGVDGHGQASSHTLEETGRKILRDVVVSKDTAGL